MALLENWHLKEVGMPIDRRDSCHAYPHYNTLPILSALEWQILAEDLPLSLMLRYMIRSQAAIVLTDREGHIVHVNVNWVNITGVSVDKCDGKCLHTLFNKTSDEKAMVEYHKLIEAIHNKQGNGDDYKKLVSTDLKSTPNPGTPRPDSDPNPSEGNPNLTATNPTSKISPNSNSNSNSDISSLSIRSASITISPLSTSYRTNHFAPPSGMQYGLKPDVNLSG
jgi:hypothetical protein